MESENRPKSLGKAMFGKSPKSKEIVIESKNAFGVTHPQAVENDPSSQAIANQRDGSIAMSFGQQDFS
jgi:hypothetical protein